MPFERKHHQLIARAAVFSRDVIDLTMMGVNRSLIKSAMEKAEFAYGASVKRDLEKSIDRVLNKEGWVDRCIDAMNIGVPKALIFQRILALGRHAGVECKLDKPHRPTQDERFEWR
jgi:hypothetical protein